METGARESGPSPRSFRQFQEHPSYQDVEQIEFEYHCERRGALSSPDFSPRRSDPAEVSHFSSDSFQSQTLRGKDIEDISNVVRSTLREILLPELMSIQRSLRTDHNNAPVENATTSKSKQDCETQQTVKDKNVSVSKVTSILEDRERSSSGKPEVLSTPKTKTKQAKGDAKKSSDKQATVSIDVEHIKNIDPQCQSTPVSKMTKQAATPDVEIIETIETIAPHGPGEQPSRLNAEHTLSKSAQEATLVAATRGSKSDENRPPQSVKFDTSHEQSFSTLSSLRRKLASACNQYQSRRLSELIAESQEPVETGKNQSENSKRSSKASTESKDNSREISRDEIVSQEETSVKRSNTTGTLLIHEVPSTDDYNKNKDLPSPTKDEAKPTTQGNKQKGKQKGSDQSKSNAKTTIDLEQKQKGSTKQDSSEQTTHTSSTTVHVEENRSETNSQKTQNASKANSDVSVGSKESQKQKDKSKGKTSENVHVTVDIEEKKMSKDEHSAKDQSHNDIKVSVDVQEKKTESNQQQTTGSSSDNVTVSVNVQESQSSTSNDKTKTTNSSRNSEQSKTSESSKSIQQTIIDLYENKPEKGKRKPSGARALPDPGRAPAPTAQDELQKILKAITEYGADSKTRDDRLAAAIQELRKEVKTYFDELKSAPQKASERPERRIAMNFDRTSGTVQYSPGASEPTSGDQKSTGCLSRFKSLRSKDLDRKDIDRLEGLVQQMLRKVDDLQSDAAATPQQGGNAPVRCYIRNSHNESRPRESAAGEAIVVNRSIVPPSPAEHETERMIQSLTAADESGKKWTRIGLKPKGSRSMTPENSVRSRG